MKKKFTFLLFLLLLIGHAFAHPDNENTFPFPLVFRHLNTNNGLVSNYVNCILQDRYGFMWFGTEKGLNRYDGKSFIVFTNNPKDNNSISGNNVTALYEAQDGKLWIGTYNNGLTIYDPIYQTFKRFVHNDKQLNSINKGYVSQIYEDKEGRFWICLYGGGLELFNQQDGTFIHHVWKENDSNTVAGNKVKSIYEMAPGKYLVGTFEAGNGIVDIASLGRINEYDYNSNTFSKFPISNLQIPSNYGQGEHQLERLVHVIFPDKAGNVWFGSYCGILKYNPRNKSWHCYEHVETDNSCLSNNTIRTISEVNGKMYFGTEGGGLSILDTSTGTFTNYKNDPFNFNSLSDDEILKLYKDSDNRLWIATHGGGINIVDPPNDDFVLFPNQLLNIAPNRKQENVTIRAVCPSGNGNVLVGSYSGLSLLNTISHKTKLILGPKQINTSSKKLNTCNVFVIAPAGEGKYWVSVSGKLAQLNLHDFTVSEYFKKQIFNTYRNKLENIPINSLVEVSDRLIYLSFMAHTIIAYDSRNHIAIDSFPKWRSNFITMDGNENIWSINFKADSDYLGGIKRINKSWQARNYIHEANNGNSLSSNNISCLYCASDNNIWIATDKGLDVLNPATNLFSHYKNIPNFPDSLIKAMTEDQDGNMWMITDQTLIKMNLDTKNISSFWVNKDLPVHKLEDIIVYDSVTKSIYFTANEGLVHFFPERLNYKVKNPSIYITDIKLFNKDFYSDTSALFKKKYHFSYDQNFITIDFTTINYSDQYAEQYAYKLDGLDKDWNDIGNKHEANFTNLPPGKYTFFVKSKNSAGIWIEDKFPITIIIDPPWWETFWFYLLCIAGLLISIFSYNRYRTNIFKRQKNLLEETVAERTLLYKEQKERAEESEKFRQRFLANMSHEIRTPIHAVNGLIQLLQAKQPREDQINYLNAISQSSAILLHIVNDILDLSKIESKKLQIEHADFSIKELMHQLEQTLFINAQNKGLFFQIIIDHTIPDLVSGDAYRLIQVLLNLVGNAIKFTEKGGVKINARKEKSDDKTTVISFVITDTGIGIPSNKIKQLFDDFFQANDFDSRKYGGTGLGLSISKHLVELMGGKIFVKSQENIGSEFSFTIPFKNTRGSELHQKNKERQKVDGDVLNGLNILLADDNEYNRTIVLDVLNLKSKVNIDTAVNGKEVLIKLEKHHYDVILMDIQMPVINGIDATKIIRTSFQAPKNRISIIAFTADALSHDLEFYQHLGMNAFVTKPFSNDELISVIAIVTNRIPETTYDRNIKLTNNNDSVTNLQYLEDFCEGDRDRMSKYISLYLDAIPDLKNDLLEATTIKDFDRIAQIIHAFKPKWVMMGMNGSSQLGKTIENECQNKSEKVFELLKDLINNVGQSIDELSKF